MATATAKRTKTKFRPLDDRVLVQPNEAEETTAGGIVLPDSAREKPQRGTVISCGPGKLLDTGSRGQMSVKGPVNDRDTIQAILGAAGLPADSPPRAPARDFCDWSAA